MNSLYRRGPYSVGNWGDDSSLSDINERRGRGGDGFDNMDRGGQEFYSKCYTVKSWNHTYCRKYELIWIFLHFQIIICTWQCYVNICFITAYDNGAKSKFSWDFMYQAFDPKTQYQIKRPQAEIRPHPLFVSIHKFIAMNL